MQYSLSELYSKSSAIIVLFVLLYGTLCHVSPGPDLELYGPEGNQNGSYQSKYI
jgi:hypothetical protein